MDQIDKEIDEIERELENTIDPKRQRELQRALRDIGEEEGDRERWEDEGQERGWK